jgi:N4-gp56 family major capsid protein
MAVSGTTVQANNKLIVFRKEITREYIRENLFSPYMSAEATAIIRLVNDLKKGGEQINVPLVARLKGQPIATGTLAGNEENIDNYGFRAYVDWARSAVKISNAEEQKSSVDLFAEAKPLLSDWGKELQRDEIIDAFYALPVESAPAALGSVNGQRVNGIIFDSATATQRNTWVTDNADRVLFGGSQGNLSAGNFATSASNITAGQTLSAAMLNKAKRLAKKANPRIRPYKLKNGREYFVVFAGANAFRDLQNDTTIINANTQARPREGDGLSKNPLFQDGDLLYNGMIVREIPEMDVRLPTFYVTAGSGSIQIAPVFLVGQSAMAFVWGRMPTPTFLREDDYQFYRGAGVKMCYGLAKIAKKNPTGNLKEWGVFTLFVSAPNDT